MPEIPREIPVDIPEKQRLHALLARRLVAACGGLAESARACRLKESRLSECQQVGTVDMAGRDTQKYLPVDVVFDLEEYCGRPIVTGALAPLRPCASETGGLLAEVCETTEAAADVMRAVREALADKELTPTEKARIHACILAMGEQLRDLAAATERGTP